MTGEPVPDQIAAGSVGRPSDIGGLAEPISARRWSWRCSASCAGDAGGGIGGVAVEGCAGSVIPHRGAGVGVGSGFLDVAERDAGVERGGDERVSQSVRSDGLLQSGAAGDPADDPPGAVPIEPIAGWSEEGRSVAAFANGQVDRAGGPRGERGDGFLAALAGDGPDAVPALGAQVLDIRAGCSGYPQPIESEQQDQRVLGGGAEHGRDEEGADLVAVQADGVRFVVQPRPPDMRGREWSRRSSSTALFVQSGDGGQAAGNRGPGPGCCRRRLDVQPDHEQSVARGGQGAGWGMAGRLAGAVIGGGEQGGALRRSSGSSWPRFRGLPALRRWPARYFATAQDRRRLGL
jgi:hypothetical protein